MGRCVSIYLLSPSTLSLNPALRLRGCGLNGDVIEAQGKSILHLHVCEADRGHKCIARSPKRNPAQAARREYPIG